MVVCMVQGGPRIVAVTGRQGCVPALVGEREDPKMVLSSTSVIAVE